jgi:hypothetical protein
MGSYIELWFACLINWMKFTNQGDGANYGMYINNVYLALSSVLLIAFPFWMYLFLKKNYNNLHNKNFAVKYDKVYDGV